MQSTVPKPIFSTWLPRKPRGTRKAPFSRWCERGSQPLVSVLSVIILPIIAFCAHWSHGALLESVRLSKTVQLTWVALALIPMLVTLVVARAFDRVADMSIKELVDPSPLNLYLRKVKELETGMSERDPGSARSCAA